MCEHCEYDEEGGLKRLRDDSGVYAWLEEFSDGWWIVVSATARCCGADCEAEGCVRVAHCPMCGRELVE